MYSWAPTVQSLNVSMKNIIIQTNKVVLFLFLLTQKKEADFVVHKSSQLK